VVRADVELVDDDASVEVDVDKEVVVRDSVSVEDVDSAVVSEDED
jgi:hypothetical protein